MLIFCAIALPLLFAAWIFASNKLIYSLTNARICRITLLVMGALGVLGAIVCAIVFNVSLAGYSKAGEAAEVVFDNFNLFATVDTVFVVIGVFLCTVSTLLKNRASTLVPFIMPGWAAISLVWTILLSHLSEVSWFPVSVYISLYGIFCALACAIPLIPLAFRRVAYLSDAEGVEKDHISKKAKKDKKIALANKKKRLKNPGK